MLYRIIKVIVRSSHTYVLIYKAWKPDKDTIIVDYVRVWLMLDCEFELKVENSLSLSITKQIHKNSTVLYQEESVSQLDVFLDHALDVSLCTSYTQIVLEGTFNRLWTHTRLVKRVCFLIEGTELQRPYSISGHKCFASWHSIHLFSIRTSLPASNIRTHNLARRVREPNMQNGVS